MHFSRANIMIIVYMVRNNQIKHTYYARYVYHCNTCEINYQLCVVDDGDTVELITVEITVEHGADTEMMNIICNIIVLHTEISNFISYT